MKEGITSGKNRKDPTLISYKSKKTKRFLWSPLRSPRPRPHQILKGKSNGILVISRQPQILPNHERH
jgi:hypothetical protein